MRKNMMGAAALAMLLAVAACEGSDVTRVIDAETVVVKGHKLKLIGVAGPSEDASCEMERAAADRAKARLGELIAGSDVSFRKAGMACLQFMTCEAFVTANGGDVSETMKGEGLLVDNPGVDEAPRDWCVQALGVEASPQAEDAAPPEQMIAPAEPGAAEPNAPESLQTTPETPAAPASGTPPGN